MAIVLLAPSIPMLFMGEEFAAATPFQFFCDFSGVVGANVSAGRKREFAEFAAFAHAVDFPDPSSGATFAACKLDWVSPRRAPHAAWLAHCRQLLTLRRERLLPHLRGMGGHAAGYKARPPGGLRVRWRLGDGATLWLLANLCDQPMLSRSPPGAVLYASAEQAGNGLLPPWSVLWTLEPRRSG
jgi:maltooligosyltrehalose trehalohydrolase